MSCCKFNSCRHFCNSLAQDIYKLPI